MSVQARYDFSIEQPSFEAEPHHEEHLRKGGPLRRLLTRVTLSVFDYIHTRSEPRRIELLGRPFLVFPGVYNPRFSRWISFPSSEHLARHAAVKQGERILDLGTGIGVQAIFAARRGGKVIATDINRLAVDCAIHNTKLNGVADRVEVRPGDLFEPVRNQRFDSIIWLPPSFPAEPVHVRHHGWMCGLDGRTLDRFCREVGDYLKPGGRLQFSCVDRNREFILTRLKENGFHCRRIGGRLRRFPLDTVTLHEARRRKEEPAATAQPSSRSVTQES